MSKKPNLADEYDFLFSLHWTVILTSAMMAIVLVANLTGGMADLASPVGIGGIIVSLGSMLYAAIKRKSHIEDKDFQFWETSIKRMTSINVVVGIILVSLPYLPF